MDAIRYPLSFNQYTTKLQWNLREAVEGCARQNVRGFSVWRDKLAECGVKEAAKILSDNGMTVTGLCRGGMFPAADEAGRRAAIEDNLRAVEEAVAIDAQCLVLVCGGVPEGSKDLHGAHQMVRDGIAAVLPPCQGGRHAAGHRTAAPRCMRPSGPASTRSPMPTTFATSWARGSGSRSMSITCGGTRTWKQEIQRAAKADPKRLLAFHICDWMVPTTDIWLDRGMMGDGCIDIPQIRGWMEEAGYEGFAEVEILSSRWWKEDPDEVVRLCVERHATVC